MNPAVAIYVIPVVIAAASAMVFWRKPAMDFDGLARRLGATYLFAILGIFIWHGLWVSGIKTPEESTLKIALQLLFISSMAWMPVAFILSLFRRGEE